MELPVAVTTWSKALSQAVQEEEGQTVHEVNLDCLTLEDRTDKTGMVSLPLPPRQSILKRRHIKFRPRGITQKKEYTIQNMAEV
jgi:hypothetical protein